MKKILTSLATIALVSGSVASTTAWTPMHQSQKTSAHAQTLNTQHNVGVKNETAQDIANKIDQATLKLDYQQWYNQSLQANLAKFQNTFVSQKILTSAEAKMVSLVTDYKITQFSELTVALKVNDGTTSASAFAHTNVFSSETAQQIANKIGHATVKFNYEYWNGRSLKDNWTTLSSMLLNEKILTLPEASMLSLVNDQVIKNVGHFTIAVKVFDGVSSVPTTMPINVVNDGWSSEHIAGELADDPIKLDPGFWLGKDIYNYQKQLNDAIVKQGILPANNGQYLQWGHQNLGTETVYINVPCTVFKDGVSIMIQNITLVVVYA